MNIKLVSLTYLITLVTCGTSGKAKISTHYYDVDLPRLGTNPVFCGYKGSHMDINRIAAVQSLTLNECGACLKVTAKNGKFVYVMAVDKSGFGLDLNKKSFIQLFGINTGRFDAKWEKTEAIHCKGILKGGNYKTPGLNGSDKGKGGKKKLDIDEIEFDDDINFHRDKPREDIDNLYNSSISNDAISFRKKNSKTQSDTKDLRAKDKDEETIRLRILNTSKEDIDYLYKSDYFEDPNFRKMKSNPKGRKPEVISDKNLNNVNLQSRNKNGKKLTDTRRDIEDLYRRGLNRRDTNEEKHNYKKTRRRKKDVVINKDKTNPKKDRDSQELIHPNLRSRKNQGGGDLKNIEESHGIDYRRMQPLKITSDQRWDDRDDIGDITDIDFKFRKSNFKFNKHDSKTQKEKHDKEKRKNHSNKKKPQEPGYTRSEYKGNGRDDLRDFEKHHDDDNDSNYRQIKSSDIKGNNELITRDDIEDVEDFEFRKLSNQPSIKVSDDFKDIEGSYNFSFRKMRPNSVKEKTRKNKINEHNNQPENFEREGNSIDDLNDIINISYRKKSNNSKQQDNPKKDNNKGKQQDKPQKKDEKDKQHDKPSKKDSNRRIHAVKNDNEIVGYTRRDMEDIYP